MTEFETQILRRLERIDDQLGAHGLQFATLNATLAERCPEHERRLVKAETCLTDLKRMAHPSADGSRTSGVSTRVLLALIAAISALISILGSLIQHYIIGGR